MKNIMQKPIAKLHNRQPFGFVDISIAQLIETRVFNQEVMFESLTSPYC